MSKTDFALSVLSSLMGAILYALGLKEYSRLQKIAWKAILQSFKKIHLGQLLPRNELVLLNLNNYSKQISIWEYLEVMKKIQQVYTFEVFLKQLKKNSMGTIHQLTGFEIGMTYAMTCALIFYVNKSRLLRLAVREQNA